MSDLKTPDEWCRLTGGKVLDPDGWRDDGTPWETPLSWADFAARYSISTSKWTPEIISRFLSCGNSG